MLVCIIGDENRSSDISVDHAEKCVHLKMRTSSITHFPLESKFSKQTFIQPYLSSLTQYFLVINLVIKSSAATRSTATCTPNLNLRYLQETTFTFAVFAEALLTAITILSVFCGGKKHNQMLDKLQ